MPAPVYSRRFLLVSFTAGSGVIGVPAGKVWIVTNVSAVARAGKVGDSAYVLATTAGVIFAIFQVVAAQQLGFSWEGRVPLGAGELLEAQSGVGTWDMIVAGYELTAGG